MRLLGEKKTMAVEWCKRCGHSLRKHFRMNTGMIHCVSVVREYANNYKELSETPCSCQFPPPPKKKQKKRVVKDRCKAMLKGEPNHRCAHAVLWEGYCHVHYKAIPKDSGGMLQ